MRQEPVSVICKDFGRDVGRVKERSDGAAVARRSRRAGSTACGGLSQPTIFLLPIPGSKGAQ